MECEHVERVAHPLQRLAVGGHPDTRDILDVPAGAVAAGDPLWVKQNEIAGARHGHAFVDTENSTRDVGGVDRQLHCPWERNVARCRHSGGLCISLGLAVERRDELRRGGAGEAGGKDQSQRGTAHRTHLHELKDGGIGLAGKSHGVTRTPSRLSEGGGTLSKVNRVVTLHSVAGGIGPSMSFRLSMTPLLLGAAFFLPVDGASAQVTPSTGAQPPAPTTTTGATSQPVEENGDEEEIVVTGQRARGSVVGDIPPEKTLNAGDVRATGATNITELLAALAPEIGSSRGRGGGQPVVLLNGQRVSGFRELRDIPTEAIQRVEILPEEVALKYGYRADQRVVNIVLRQRFRSTVAQLAANTATEGGYVGGSADLTRLMIQRNGRTQFNLHAEGNGMLTEDERDIRISATAARRDRRPGARRALAHRKAARRPRLGDVQPPGVRQRLGDFEHRGRAYRGPQPDRARRHFARAARPQHQQRQRTCRGDAQLGQGAVALERRRQRRLGPRPHPDRARRCLPQRPRARDAHLGRLDRRPPTGRCSSCRPAMPRPRFSSAWRRSISTAAGAARRTSIPPRSAAPPAPPRSTSICPISRRNRDFSALGNLTLNANAELDQLSDFGSLTTIGAGLNCSPVDRLNFITSWTREEGAPTIQQFGDPVIETPGSRIFDFTTGQTVLVNATTGGNPDLLADRRNVVKLGVNWQPSAKTDLRLRADYVHTTIQQPDFEHLRDRGDRGGLPRALRARCRRAQLVSVDLRPVNFDSSQRDTLRARLRLHQAAEVAAAVASRHRSDARRNSAGRAGGGRSGSSSGPPPERSGSVRRRRRGGPGGGGGGFGGGRGSAGAARFGGGNRGRHPVLADRHHHLRRQGDDPSRACPSSIISTATRRDRPAARRATRSRRRPAGSTMASACALSANWRSGTRVDSLTGDNLHFSPLATFDLRLFANPGDIPELVVKHPWLRGTQVRFEVTNMFDAKPKVRDAAGNVPLELPGRPARPARPHGRHFDPQIVPAPAELLPPAARAAPAATTPPARRLIPHFAEMCFSAAQ